MKQTKTFIPTMKETPSKVASIPHQLLLRAGFIRQHASGIYTLLPLATKIIKKIEMIVREEIEKIGALECMFPTFHQAEQKEILHSESRSLCFTDHEQQLYELTTTNDTHILSLMKEKCISYKELPLIFFHIGRTFIDLLQSNRGLFRSREAYLLEVFALHASKTDAACTYEQMQQVLEKVLHRLNLSYQIIQADATLDELKHLQIVALTEEGNEQFVKSNASSFIAKRALAAVPIEEQTAKVELLPLEKVRSSQPTVEDAARSLQIPLQNVIKTVVFKLDDRFVLILHRGDHELSEGKLQQALQSSVIKRASDREVLRLLACEIEEVGPVKSPVDVQVYADQAIRTMVNGFCGANERHRFYANVNVNRDFAVDDFFDLRLIQAGEPSPDGYGEIAFAKGVVLGSLMQLGTVQSEKQEANFVDHNGKPKPFEINRYELFISHIFAMLAEQYHDEYGFKWPPQVAPYDLHLILIHVDDIEQKQVADDLYHLLKTYRYRVLYDDRDERAGVKFADADLIGLPIRLTIGKKASEGIVEAKFRQSGEVVEWQKEEITEKLQSFFP